MTKFRTGAPSGAYSVPFLCGISHMNELYKQVAEEIDAPSTTDRRNSRKATTHRAVQ